MRSVLPLLALALAMTWFAWPAPRYADGLVETQARSREGVDLQQIVYGLALAQRDLPGALPDKPAQARELLDLALAQEAVKAEWPLRALGALDPNGRALAAAAERSPLPRSSTHPQVPPEVVGIVTVLGRQIGSGAAIGVEPPGPATAWPGATSQDVAWGVWAVVEQGLPDDRAELVLAAAVRGMEAHHLQPDTLDELAALLSPEVLALPDRYPVDPRLDLLEAYGSAAREALR